MADVWWEDMACRAADPRVFEEPPLPVGKKRNSWIDKRWAEPALEMCGGCKVRERCLDEALGAPWNHDQQLQARMVIGGLMPDEFETLRRRARFAV